MRGAGGRRIVYVPLEEVVPAVVNPKRHDVVGVGRSMAALGYIDPVVVDGRTGRLVGGHGRVEALVALRDAGGVAPDGVKVVGGVWKLPVVTGWASVDDAAADAALVALNRYGERGGWDDDGLADMLAGLDEEWRAVAGYDDREWAVLIGSLASQGPVMLTDPDVAPPTPEEPTAKRGEVWQLGPHRVMCGDSTSPADVATLLDGREAQSMVTDPPYGLDYGDTVAFRREMGLPQRPTDDSHVRNDLSVDAETLWAAAFPLWIAALRKKASAFYCWGPAGPPEIDFGVALRAAGGSIHGSVIWVKSSFSFSRAEHKYQHEPCWYGWRSDGTHTWRGPNNETSVWEYPKPSSSKFHPTQKPIDLIRRCVRNITDPGGLVIDPFLGSGTTVIAAYAEGRVCFGMEIDPKYVDVIVSRWQDLTGEPAKLVEST